ncbi:MAG: hypothetical protein QJT80_03165 [Candidatus Thiocaldithrix dubininis]|uniref:Type II secretion system protein GspC N-terminal domain-containing protein n=1 Tax=Candidatus Thiocaldithrix dubininis TaxID=3080823 RepID=A0AA95H989_9GAMM|nr:MAG: hypothetical protein QJT80_03165 [Candidatus Thiocaldithrix dubininis]
MKKLLNPPIQLILWLVGLSLLGLSAWSLLSLKLQDEAQAESANINIKIPDAAVLDIPNVMTYTQLVQAPLFWASRKEYVPPPVEQVVQAPVEAPPIDTNLPEGRMIGIVNVGEDAFALMQDAAGQTQRLKAGDKWGAWEVKAISYSKMTVALGGQEQEIPLIADFAAPEESKQLAQVREAQAQIQQQKASAVVASNTVTLSASGSAPPQQVNPNAINAANAASAPPQPVDNKRQAPAPLTVEEALAARQRLMASRWSALTGEAPPSSGGVPVQKQ